MNINKKILRTVVSMILLLSFAVTAYGSKADINSANDKIDSLEQEKGKMEDLLSDLDKIKADTSAYVKKLDANLDDISSQLDVLTAQVEAKEADIAVTGEELEAAKVTEAKQYNSMKIRIRYMYEKGDTNYIDLLLNSESLSELLNRAEFISQITEYDRNMLNVYKETKEDIIKKEAILQEERTQLKTLLEKTESKQKSIEKLVSEKTKELNQYESQMAVTKQQISQYQKDIEDQENNIKAIEAEIKRKEEEARKKAEEEKKKYNTVKIGDIKFIWPCPSSSKITSRFGDREAPVAGASTNHQGVDISSSSGNDIIASAAGEVIISTYSYSAGNYVMINHGGGVSSVYMHASRLLVNVGDQVKQGQVIAKVGSTGYSTGPHLHFGIRLNGSYVNPLKYVSP